MRRQKQLSACKNGIICAWEIRKRQWYEFLCIPYYKVLQVSSKKCTSFRPFVSGNSAGTSCATCKPSRCFSHCMFRCLTAVCTQDAHATQRQLHPTQPPISQPNARLSEHDLPEKQLSAWVRGGLFLSRLLQPYSSYLIHVLSNTWCSAVSCICPVEEPLGSQDHAVIEPDVCFTFPSPTSPYCVCSLGWGRRWTR